MHFCVKVGEENVIVNSPNYKNGVLVVKNVSLILWMDSYFLVQDAFTLWPLGQYFSCASHFLCPHTCSNSKLCSLFKAFSGCFVSFTPSTKYIDKVSGLYQLYKLLKQYPVNISVHFTVLCVKYRTWPLSFPGL